MRNKTFTAKIPHGSLEILIIARIAVFRELGQMARVKKQKM